MKKTLLVIFRFGFRKDWSVVWLLCCGLTACSPAHQHLPGCSRDHAFITYWPPSPEHPGLRLAVKDLIDMKGVVTTAGSEYLARTRQPAQQDATCLERARSSNVQFVGKTNLTEFAITVSGKNDYFGTPRNRWDGKHDVIPGGSSSGSAVAVATGRADVALGTDTGGSIRVPAACCGIYGLKTTYGLVPTKGVFPISPQHLDTIGPMAKDIPHLVDGMDLLQEGFAQQYSKAVADQPTGRDIKIGRLYLPGTNPAIDQAIDETLAGKGFRVFGLSEEFQAQWIQADKDGETVALADAWINDQQYADKKGVSTMTKLVIGQGEREYKGGYRDALARKKAWQRNLRSVFKQVDFIAVATLQSLPPKFPFWGSSAVFEALVFGAQNTVGVNLAGNPALAIPILMPSQNRSGTTSMTSLQFVGRPFSEAQLINAGRIIGTKHAH